MAYLKEEKFDLTGYVLKADGLDIGGTELTGAELTALDGLTATTAELNILDGVTATAAELNMAADSSANVEAVTTANVITAAESGKTFFLGGTDGFASTLPAAAAGLRFTFILATETAMSTTAHTIVAPSAILEGAIMSAGGTDIAVDGGTTITIDDQATPTALFGDRVDVICDGTKYYVTGQVRANTAMTVA